MISNRKPPQFIIDENGKRTGVILDIELYEQLLEAAEELDDTRAYDQAQAEGGEYIPLEQAIREIEDAHE
jgi:hypothetical protein